ncbi:MAG: MFS transporter [Desulfobulbaceae bacterium]|nr:MFS transporter [Desulfobulbaceae bacterium]HIJ79741.1 MFS transporter [Deltaproteobacteria bacterium]
MPRSFSTNIYSLYLIKLAKWLMLIMPIVALFYSDNGLDHFDIYLLQAVYSLSVALLEIPSGYMADVIGRKKSLVIGSVLGTLGYGIYSISSGFYGFLAAEMVLGLGGSFISGSDSAILYESLVATDQKHSYFRLEGRITSLGHFGETIAALAGGFIAVTLSYRAVYLSQTLIAALAIPASLYLLEPPRTGHISKPGLGHILAVCKESLVGNKKLSATILLSSLIGTCTLCMAWTSQVYFVNMGLAEKSITPLWVLLNLTVALVAMVADKVVAKIGRRIAIALIILIIPGAYILLGVMSLMPALLVLFVFYGIRGYATPLLKDLVNRYCASETRATVLSIRSLLIRVSFALLGPFIGSLSAGHSLAIALQVSGLILMLLALIAGLFLFLTLREET